MFLCGAALSPAYIEPFFLTDSEGPPGFLNRMNNLGWGGRFTVEDVHYLERFPVYHLEADLEKWEPVFRHLAEWLLEDTKKSLVASPRQPAAINLQTFHHSV